MKSNLISVINKAKETCFLLLALTLYASSFAQDDNDTLQEDNQILLDTLEEVEPTSIFDSYFEPIPAEEAEDNYNAINTSGVISNYTEVPNNRPINNSRVSDPHNMLPQSAIDTINKIAVKLENETGYELAVVCLNSIGDNDPHMYATDLFNHWGIGDAEADNGVLLMVVNDIHKVSTITGRGTEAVLTDAQTAEIHEDEMIPYFKEQDYVTGVVRGVQAITDVLYGVETAYSFSNVYSGNNNYIDYSEEDDKYSSDYEYDYEPKAWYESSIFSIYFLITAIVTGIYLIMLVISFFVKNLHTRYHVLKPFTVLIIPILFPIPFLILYFVNRKLMDRWRNTERFSDKTGGFMIKLDEQSDNKHLEKGQVTEEQIKSIDYDVWVTEDGSDILVLAYKKWFSRYNKCPKCKYKTWFKEYDRTISAATYSSSGTGERKYSCKNCSHSKVTRYTIPKKTKSSSSSSGGYSSGGGYSSSSSGSSWGGGSSRGGGSTSGW